MAVPISNVTRRQVYSPSGTGGAGPYSFTFEILANTDIAVYKDDTLLTLTTHYTVTINSNGTGSVTITAAGLALSPTSPTQYAIVGNRTIQRTTDFTTGGDFFANAINDELDQQTIFAQQNAEGLARALTAPQTDPTSINMTLPSKASRANKTLSFDANGDPTPGVSAADVANATTYATNAANSATAAASSASSASSSASSASSSASTASTQASNASTSATNASNSASSASTSATNAASSASTAATQASNASTSATNAASSASAASTSAANAATSATSAETAKTAAESARDATLAAYDSFDDRYLGAKSSDPSVDNDGNALTAGSLYFNSVDNVMKLWTGSAWVAAYVSGAGFMDLSSSQTAAGTKTFSSNPILSGGTANGVAYLNGSKVLTTGSALVFDGTNLGVGVTPSANAGVSTLNIANYNRTFSALTMGSNANSAGYVGYNMGNTSTSNTWKYITADTGSALYFAGNEFRFMQFASGSAGATTSGTQAMTLDASGNLGIGTTTPTSTYSARLASLAAAGTTALALDAPTGTNTSINWYYNGTAKWSTQVLTTGEYRWYDFVAGSTRMTLDASGNLLVGKTSSSATTGDGFGFSNDGQGHAVSAYTTNAAYTWRVYSTGAAAYRFYVGYGGTVYATSTTITAISDQRLKENIRDLDDGLDVVMALKPRKFDWKEGKGADIKNARGFIAQEFEAVLPDMIEEWADPAPEGEEPYKAINANLIPTLVKAIQELKAEFDAYKASHP
jgi:hypothetical protein